MNNLRKILPAIGLLTIMQVSHAEEILPDAYSDGTILTAEELNKIRDAVNDNNARAMTPGPVGAQGEVGAVGAQGTDGAQGAQGPAGATGDAGAVGAQGTDGAQGAQGPAGATGDAGAQGAAGAAGTNAPGPYIYGTAPTAFDGYNHVNAYTVGSIWVDTVGGAVYILIDDTANSAVWSLITSPTSGPIVYAIGDIGPAGGKVFYVSNGGLNGLEAAPTDSADAVWGCDGTAIVGADGTAIGTGRENTADIMAGSSCTTAASVANAYVHGEFSDWYLPSVYELNELYKQKDVVAGFSEDVYWSSTEVSSSTAWYVGFWTEEYNYSPKDRWWRVRAVRDF